MQQDPTGCYDAAIVGYGPVGQALALSLGRKGHRILVLERHPGLYGQARAGHIDGEVMRILQGLGVAEDLEPLISPVHRYEMVSADWEVLQRIDAGVRNAGWQNDYLFYQPDIEDILHHAVLALPNVTVRQGCEVSAVTAGDSEVLVSATDRASGVEETHAARWLVGADGARSFVRRATGMTASDLGFAPADFLVIDIKHRDPAASIPRMGELRQVLDPERPRHASRWNGPSHSRTEFMLLPGEAPQEMATAGRCWELLERYWGIDRGSGELVRHAVYTFETTLADQWHQGRVLLAGDAAHVMPPFLGQGLCSGLRDVANLGWRLDLVLRDRCGHDLLDGYQAERRPHVKGIIEASAQIADVCTVLDPEAARWRDAALRSAPAAHSFERSLQKGTLYAGSPHAGQLFPQGRVHHDGRTALLDDLLGTGWRVLSSRPVPEGLLGAAARQALDQLDVTVRQVSRGRAPGALVDIDAAYDFWFTETGTEVAIERPDHYLFGAGPLSALPAMLADLGRQTSILPRRAEACA